MRRVFLNTIPHSGTHLVAQVLVGLGYEHNIVRNRFYTERPYFRRRQKAGINWRSSTEIGGLSSIFEKKSVLVSVASPRLARESIIARSFSNISEGQFIIGHMPHTEAGQNIVERYTNNTITIIRDPRDMALSMIGHIRTRPQHHAHRYFYSELSSDSERLEAILLGYHNRFGHLTSLRNMYRSMLRWQNTTGNLSIKFEELVGEKGGGDAHRQLSCVRLINSHLGALANDNDEQLREIAESAFGAAGTFRKGRIGGWESALTAGDKRLFKDKIGELLIELDYE